MTINRTRAHRASRIPSATMPAAKPKKPKKAPKKPPAAKRAAVTKPKKATPTKTPAANRARAKNPVEPHGYEPDKRMVDNDKRVSFDVHLDAVWAVVDKAWEGLMKEHNIPKTTPAYEHYYRPGQIIHISEPDSWYDSTDAEDDQTDSEDDFPSGPEGKSFNRAKTIDAAADFAGSFLGMILNVNSFEGEDHVLRKCAWPKGTPLARSEKLKRAYAKSFAETVRALNRDGWDLRPHLWTKKTRVVEKTVDAVGGFVRR